MVVSLPALHLVARAFPDAERRMLTNFPVNAKAPAASAVLDGSGLVQGYERYEVGLRNPLKLLGLVWRIRRWKPDVLVYLAASRGVDVARRDAAFFRLAGIRKMIGVPLTWEMQKNHVDADGVLEPEAERLVRCIAELGEGRLQEGASWDLGLSEEEHQKAAEVLRPLGGKKIIAASIGTKVQAKDWGAENWFRLLGRVAKEFPDHALALAGAPNEREQSEAAAEGWRQAGGGPVVNLCGALAPRESAAMFQRAEIFIGHDSGPMHLAATVGTPCVAVFAARNKPRMWFPYGEGHRVLYHRVSCWGCALETCIVEKKRCIYSITVDEVMEAVRDTMRVEVNRG